MTIDWWTLGLQAVNVLILMWLLSRVFWRPVANAIAKRKEASQAMLDAAKAAQSKADAIRAELTEERKSIAAEREAILLAARQDADNATKAALLEAHEKTEKIVATAQISIARATDAAQKKTVTQAAELATEIASKLLETLNTAIVQEAFFQLLLDSIANLPEAERTALAQNADGLDLVSAYALEDADRTKFSNAIHKALGGTPDITFMTDPELIAGMEIRTAHFILHNSWQSDLAEILKELKNAA
ncbi:F-type H+-transporting ATPase subunit b [Thalassospira sp. MBR-102]|jgi:F-type H+-transporting ATPase subunit b|uniref:ATP synthase subunit b n=1 Tax=Thalassospira xiamenensis TaxID=220697 RepID=A0ABR5Y1I5_9PROT|nr:MULTISPECIES: F0F1 ATP synthase subunit delta [Thalassospira]KZD03206.1 hypothetical protein AUP40_18610 [Thalassospira xiamenensis]KZD06009.1 hypothetical protein AUP45_04190 [Thalassospira xiamenensis]MAB35529.1 ATPase [Thalassospira sp.]MAL28937.1 ATPase [Thalassospira sp.]MBA05686.1 ATPase [Thalassospira sp.]|tara:strand:- start:700 stop:1437 length:738 start_codon:yes stop_codon:yes gene_type:complete